VNLMSRVRPICWFNENNLAPNVSHCDTDCELQGGKEPAQQNLCCGERTTLVCAFRSLERSRQSSVDRTKCRVQSQGVALYELLHTTVLILLIFFGLMIHQTELQPSRGLDIAVINFVLSKPVPCHMSPVPVRESDIGQLTSDLFARRRVSSKSG